MYGFFPQATAGSCKPPKPKNLDCVGEGKWESWNQLADMEKVQKMGVTDHLVLINCISCRAQLRQSIFNWQINCGTQR